MTKEFTSYINETNKPKPQTERAREDQVQNNAGGFVFQVTDATRLQRFLVLGTTGGTYYQKEKELTKQNVDWLVKLIKSSPENERLVGDTVATISAEGRALRQSPAIFTAALLLKYGKDKTAARSVAGIVARTATHVYELSQYLKALGGWNRTKRRAIADWFLNRTPESLAYQAVKYRSRAVAGAKPWTLRDLLRLSHAKGVDQRVGNFILGKDTDYDQVGLEIIAGFQDLQKATTVEQVLDTLDLFPSLPWEALPTQFHKEPAVWKKLFDNAQLKGQALVRNITRLARIRALDDLTFARRYADALVDEDMIRKTRLHPLNYLNAVVVHQEGQIVRPKNAGMYGTSVHNRKKDWETNSMIVDALNEGFHKSFKHVEASGKRFSLNIDVSGSMASAAASGLDLSSAQVAGAMALAIAKTEPVHQIRGFANGGGYGKNELVDLGISADTSLTDAMRKVQLQNFGSTDCALPMLDALEKKQEFDVFVVITDNETWHGKIHPFEALKKYRKEMGIDAKLIVVACTATEFSIADPNDPGMLDVVGADSNLPKLITEFAKGNI